MPSRVIREGLLDSQRYWSVTLEARLLFVHLLLLADDCGLVSLAPVFVRRRAFDDAPSQAKVDKLIEQLHDADLIRIYGATPARHGFIPRFRQRLRITRCKHPMPPPELYADDSDAQRIFSEIKTKADEMAGSSPALDGQRSDTRQPEVEVEGKGKGKEKGSARGARKSLLPEGFTVSPRVQAWAKDQGFAHPERYLDHFIGWARANGALKADWDEAFMNCIRADWPKLRANGAHQPPAQAPKRIGVLPCDYCEAKSIGVFADRLYCPEHQQDAEAQKPRTRAVA